MNHNGRESLVNIFSSYDTRELCAGFWETLDFLDLSYCGRIEDTLNDLDGAGDWYACKWHRCLVTHGGNIFIGFASSSVCWWDWNVWPGFILFGLFLGTKVAKIFHCVLCRNLLELGDLVRCSGCFVLTMVYLIAICVGVLKCGYVESCLETRWN